MLVAVEKVGTNVVRHEEIGPTIVVVIGPLHAHATLLVGIVNPGLLRDFFEGSIAAIMKQQRGFAFDLWNFNGDTFVVKRRGPWLREIVNIGMNVARDEQVEAAIMIIVDPGGAYAKAARTDVSALGGVFEPASAQVVI